MKVPLPRLALALALSLFATGCATTPPPDGQAAGLPQLPPSFTGLTSGPGTDFAAVPPVMAGPASAAPPVMPGPASAVVPVGETGPSPLAPAASLRPVLRPDGASDEDELADAAGDPGPGVFDRVSGAVTGFQRGLGGLMRGVADRTGADLDAIAAAHDAADPGPEEPVLDASTQALYDTYMAAVAEVRGARAAKEAANVRSLALMNEADADPDEVLEAERIFREASDRTRTAESDLARAWEAFYSAAPEAATRLQAEGV